MSRIANSPVKNATIMPMMSGIQGMFERPCSSASGISRTAPPAIAMMDSRNEKSAAAFRFSPENSAPAMVEPERETPESVPSPCMAPMISASFGRIAERPRRLPRARTFSAAIRRADVIRKQTPRYFPASAFS